MNGEVENILSELNIKSYEFYRQSYLKIPTDTNLVIWNITIDRPRQGYSADSVYKCVLIKNYKTGSIVSKSYLLDDRSMDPHRHIAPTERFEILRLNPKSFIFSVDTYLLGSSSVDFYENTLTDVYEQKDDSLINIFSYTKHQDIQEFSSVILDNRLIKVELSPNNPMSTTGYSDFILLTNGLRPYSKEANVIDIINSIHIYSYTSAKGYQEVEKSKGMVYYEDMENDGEQKELFIYFNKTLEDVYHLVRMGREDRFGENLLKEIPIGFKKDIKNGIDIEYDPVSKTELKVTAEDDYFQLVYMFREHESYTVLYTWASD